MTYIWSITMLSYILWVFISVYVAQHTQSPVCGSLVYAIATMLTAIGFVQKRKATR